MAASTLNFNIGVLGHIDSGKTSLVKALSTVASTACYDKSPQSRERGITIDLGFSSFVMEIPDHLKEEGYEKMQITLVDCPGHASLIRTIIGGAQIIDLMILVVDVTKGMQTQTAECLVIGEITCSNMIVVLNKIDLLSSAKKEATIEKMSKKMKLTLQNTRFRDVPIVAVAAKPGGPDSSETEALGMKSLIETLQRHIFVPKRDKSGPLVFAVDHCFSIKGQGTVMTGTVLQGGVAINDTVEIPALKETRKVKSMQMFHQPMQQVKQGDRVGICVTQFDPKLLERGLVCSPGYIPIVYAAIIDASKIPYYKGSIQTKAKFHISAGHETVMAKVSLFGLQNKEPNLNTFDFGQEYVYQEELITASSSEEDIPAPVPARQFALLEFERGVPLIPNCLVIGSRLDADIHSNSCRLAFQGKVLLAMEDRNYAEVTLPGLKVYKIKHREGLVERLINDQEVVGKNIFKRKTNIQAFERLRVKLSTGESGIIEGVFGQTGKVKIRIPEGLSETTLNQFAVKKKKGKGADPEQPTRREPIKILLEFKRYIYDPDKRMIQTK